MQRQKKQFIVIMILLVVCAAAYIGLRVYNDRQDKKEEAEAEAAKITVTDLKSDDITAFSYIYQDQTLSFAKEDGTWYYEGDKSVSIDQDQISAMLSAVTAIEATDSVKDYDSLSDYGLDEPVNVITLTTADGTTTLNIGDENTMLSDYYLTKEGDDTVYLVESSVKTTFDKSVEDLTAVASTETEASLSEVSEGTTE